MTTRSYGDVIDNTSDAGFRNWAGKLHQAFLDVGLVQTSDTGQADFTTATRPTATGSGEAYVYKIYRFDDSMQATCPVFLRVEYGSYTGTTQQAVMRIGIGEGTDGAGALRGNTATPQQYVTASLSSSPGDPGQNIPFRICMVDGCFWFAFGMGWRTQAGGSATTYCRGFFFCGRSVADDGSPNADCLSAYWYSLGLSYASPRLYGMSLRYATGTTASMTSGSWCLVPGDVSPSINNNKVQVFKHYLCLPLARTVPWLFTVLANEIGEGSTFTAAPVGTVGHTYLGLGPNFGNNSTNGLALPDGSGTKARSFAMVWE